MQKDLPIGLKDLATVMAVSYQVAWKWSKSEDFPRVRMVRKSGFDAWWKRTARRTGEMGSNLHKLLYKAGNQMWRLQIQPADARH